MALLWEGSYGDGLQSSNDVTAVKIGTKYCDDLKKEGSIVWTVPFSNLIACELSGLKFKFFLGVTS